MRKCAASALRAFGFVLCFIAASALLPQLAWPQGQSTTPPAQNWPSKPIRIIVPYPAGGLSDIFARLISDKLAQSLGVSVFVDNRPGGNTLIGTQATAQSDPDGYTLLMTNAALSINQSLVENLPYNLKKDLAPVIHLGESYGLIVVGEKFPAKTLPELIELAKASPGKYSAAVPGLGTNYRIALEQLKEITNIKLNMIPYRGSPPAIADLLGGQVDIGIDSLSPLASHVKAGKLRALAVLSAVRTPDFPDVPTTAEVALPDVVMYAYNALLAPSATPRPVIDKLNAAVNAILQQPDTIAQARVTGLKLYGGTPERLGEVIDGVSGTYARVIKSANIKPE
jgi:tripartite-type tricarboxylate transporter receptor subunit TctC